MTPDVARIPFRYVELAHAACPSVSRLDGFTVLAAVLPVALADERRRVIEECAAVADTGGATPTGWDVLQIRKALEDLLADVPSETQP